jgi:hypothetical protein
MAINKRLLVKPPSTGITPSEHFGVVLYEGDGSSSHSINGGKFGAGAYFNGSSGVIDISTTSTTPIDFSQRNYSISFWINTTQVPSTYGVIMAKFGGSDSIRAFHCHLRANGTIRFYERNTGNQDESDTTTTINDGNWHHIVITKSSTQRIIYIDGSADVTTSTTFTANSGGSENIKLGRDNSGNADWLEGKLDQVRLFTKELSSSEVSTLYAETDVESLDPLNVDTTDTLQVLGDSSCIATYRFENNEVDLSGNYDGTGTAIQYAAGRYGQAADFNGSSSNVELPTGSPFNDSDTIKSISAWVKADTTSSRVYPFSIGSTTTDDQFFNFGWIPANNYVLLFIRNGSNSNQAYHSASLTADTNWHHIVVQTTGSAVEIYLDGQSQSVSSTYAGSGSASSWISYPNYTGTVRANIGTNASFGPQYSNGQIDQVRFFNKALSAAEVTTLYNENPLVASYRFEGNANDDTRNYDGTASNVTYEYGLGFTPDLVWFKSRTGVRSHALYDSTRGANKRLVVNGTQAEISNSAFASFDSGGFTVTGTDTSSNNSGEDYVAWCLKANGGTTSSNTDGNITSTVQVNEQAGFSIIQYTSPSSPSSSTDRVGHGLGTTPAMVIVKRTDGVEDWYIWHKELGGGGSGALNKYLRFNTNAQATASNLFNTVNSTVVNLSYTSTGNLQNIAYAFAEVEGFSKFGSYTGNGSTNGPIVETGFEPAFLMIKRTDITGHHWNIWDNKRIPAGEKVLYANLTNAESSYGYIKFLSNGFQNTRTNAGVNANGGTYIYMAFAADPDTEAPTVAKSFSTVAYSGDSSSTRSIDGLGFSPSLVWIKNRTVAGWHHLSDVVRGGNNTIFSNATNAETSNIAGGYLSAFEDDGFELNFGTNGSDVNKTGEDYVAWAWKADDNEPTIFGGPAVAVYKFEDNGNDVTGGLNLTESNMSYSSSGKFNKAAEFNGNNSSFTNGSITGLPTGTNPVSISYWVYTDTSNQDAGLVGYGRWNPGGTNTGAASKYFGTMLSGGDLFFAGYYYNAAFSPAVTLPTGQWNHLVWTFDGTNLRAYLNGSLAGTVNRSSLDIGGGTGNLSITIGRNSWSGTGSEHFDGKIDQVRIYNGVVSDVGVAELYAETVSDNDDLTLGGPPETIISANANAGFSIVKYEGDGQQNHKVPHGLSAAPEIVIIKNLDQAVTWQLFGSTFFDRMQFNTGGDDGNYPLSYSSTTITLPQNGQHANNEWNASGNNYIAYCFHSVAGYSKIGSYTGSGYTTNTITTGFQPDFVMIKAYTNSTAYTSWVIFDSVRYGSSSDTNPIYANLSAAEGTRGNGSGDGDVLEISFTSTGFQLVNNAADETNDANKDYIYIAFKIN